MNNYKKFCEEFNYSKYSQLLRVDYVNEEGENEYLSFVAKTGEISHEGKIVFDTDEFGWYENVDGKWEFGFTTSIEDFDEEDDDYSYFVDLQNSFEEECKDFVEEFEK